MSVRQMAGRFASGRRVDRSASIRSNLPPPPETGMRNPGLESMGPDFGEMPPSHQKRNKETLPHSCRGRVSVA